MAKRSWEPRSYAVRTPLVTKAIVGRTVNPPRALKIGGRGEATLFSVSPSKENQGPESPNLNVSDRGKGEGSPI